jgi:3-demethoxyubiquinol 3-hydroxylase
MYSNSKALPNDVVADLRTDHAGEMGAVCIYQGILYFARDPEVRAFAARHMKTEQKHLEQIEAWLPKPNRSRLLPLWRMAGWLTGALPALVGPRAVYATVEAVEQFVDLHYGEQVQRLGSQPELRELRETLMACQSDEVAHRDEAAAARGTETPGLGMRVWCSMVGSGSRAAVSICRHI